MTNRMYQKAFPGIVLAIALSLVGTTAQASTGNLSEGLLLGKASLNGLTGPDLVSGNLASSQAVTPLQPTIPLSPVVRFSPVGAQAEQVNAAPVADARVMQPDEQTAERLKVQNQVTQSPEALELQVAQAVEDTFAPLSDEEIRQQLLIDPNLDIADLLEGPQAVPSSTFLTPSAYGADWREGYVGVSGSTVDSNREVDGSINFGFGLGDAVDNVGVELNASIISLDGFGEDGSLGFKLHKTFPQLNNLAVALGWSNPITWGAAQDAQDTFYGVVTQRYDLQPNRRNPLPLTASIGVGTGSFRSTGAIASGDNSPNLFGSVALRVIPEVSVISSWSGSALGLAVSAAPFDAPFVVTAGVSDITDNTVNSTQFVGSMGYSFKF
jgi:hypothetical protein